MSDHAADRFLERLAAQGIDEDTILRLVREPNMKRRDEWDPRFPGVRVRRWIRVEHPRGRFRTLRIVFVSAALAPEPNLIEVGTIVLEEP